MRKVVNGKYTVLTKQMQKEKDPERLLRLILAPLDLDVVKLDEKNFSIISSKKTVAVIAPVDNTPISLPVAHILTPVASYTTNNIHSPYK